MILFWNEPRGSIKTKGRYINGFNGEDRRKQRGSPGAKIVEVRNHREDLVQGQGDTMNGNLREMNP